jgi:tetratricopeptide (TPR) repeat protein
MLKREANPREANPSGAPSGSAPVGADAPRPAKTWPRIWILLGLLLALVAGVWLSGALARIPRELARRCLSDRDFEGAWQWQAMAGRLSNHDPANALLAMRIARWQGDGERFKRELAVAKRWVADSAAMRREELLALAQNGQLEGIEAELVALLPEAGEEAAEISEAYANGLAMLARFDDALSVLDAWRRDFPDDPRPEYRIGRIREHQSVYDEAEASYRRALSRRAGYFPARYSLGRVLLHQLRAEEAVEHFQACLKMPLPEAAQVELAIALKALGRGDEARPLLRQALAADSARLSASYVAIDEQPEIFKAAAEYGKLEADAGNYQEAKQWLTAALDANPLDLMSRYSLAVSLRGLGEQAEAERQFARVAAAREAMAGAGALNSRIKANPQDVEARYLLGRMILEHESERSGLYWIRSIFAYDPDHLAAHELLAEYFAAKSDRESHYARLAAYHRRMALASRNEVAPP